ncbi:MAG: hypothetical protein J2P49_04670, partial [Methylocapsa sp.]|nr:hypothetical protein [Methylocapsa sp.]
RLASAIVGLFAFAIPMAWAASPALFPKPEFHGGMPLTAKNGAVVTARVSIQSWAIPGERDPNGPTYEIPLRGFYIAHLINGDMWSNVDGQTARRETGDYWTVKSGSSMRVQVRGELAVLETIVVSKQ